MTNTERKQEKKLTPVGTILEWIDEKIKMINDHYESPDDMPLSVRGQLNELINVRKVVRAQIPEEQKVIEEAYKVGYNDGGIDGDMYDKRTTHASSEHYFQSTYRHE